MSDQSKGLLITTLGVLFIVPDSLFIRLIEAEPLTISFWRGITSAIAITAWLLMSQGTTPFRSLPKAGLPAAIVPLCIGASGILFVLAVSLTSVANVVFIVASIPVFAAIQSRIFLGERISARVALTMIAVLAGVALIAGDGLQAGRDDLLGILVAITVSVVFSGGMVAVRAARPVSMVACAPIGALIAALAVLPFTDPLSADPGQWWLYLLHGGVFIATSSALLAIGPRFISAPEVALLILLESILAPILVWAIVGEVPGDWTLTGGAVVLLALFISNLIALSRSRVTA